jgi:hypothetical protein
MGEAAIGLIGVIVGALISGAATFLLARRQEARQAQAAARLLEAELRSTAGDLLLLRASLQVEDNYADLRSQLRLPQQPAWKEHKPLLATVLTPSEWYAVASAYESIDSLRAASSREELFVRGGRAVFHDALREVLLELTDTVQAGAAAVSRLAGNPDPQPKPPAFRDALIRLVRTTDAERNEGHPQPHPCGPDPV